jgi:hypothetical protein
MAALTDQLKAAYKKQFGNDRNREANVASRKNILTSFSKEQFLQFKLSP